MAFTIQGKTYKDIVWITDPGHGVDTPGKRSPVWEDGTQLREYEFNRSIAARLLGRRINSKTSPRISPLVLEEKDIPILTRCKRANKIAKYDPDTFYIYLSIHGDAFHSGTAHGTTLFTSKGDTLADPIADVFLRGFMAATRRVARGVRTIKDIDSIKPNPFRPHTWLNRGNKEANFGVLKHTKMPAMLLEVGFYTNYIECKYMMGNKGRTEITDCIIAGMKAVETDLQNGNIR